MANGDSNTSGGGKMVRFTVGGMALAVPVALVLAVIKALMSVGAQQEQLRQVCVKQDKIEPRVRTVEVDQARLGGEVLAEIRNVKDAMNGVKLEMRDLRNP